MRRWRRSDRYPASCSPLAGRALHTAASRDHARFAARGIAEKVRIHSRAIPLRAVRRGDHGNRRGIYHYPEDHGPLAGGAWLIHFWMRFNPPMIYVLPKALSACKECPPHLHLRRRPGWDRGTRCHRRRDDLPIAPADLRIQFSRQQESAVRSRDQTWGAGPMEDDPSRPPSTTSRSSRR